MNQFIDEITEKISFEPENAQLYSTRAILYQLSQEHDNAVKDFIKAIELKPEDAKLYSQRALVYRLNEDYGNAIKDYIKAINFEPENAELYSQRAFSYWVKGDYNNAVKDFTKAIELEPENAKFYSGRGDCYASFRKYGNVDDLERCGNAIKDYTKAIELEPKKAGNAMVYLNRGQCYFETGKYDNALNDYDKAIELDPNCAEAYLERGEIHYRMENRAEALNDYGKAIDLNPEAVQNAPEYIENYLRLGDFCLYEMQDYTKAREVFYRILSNCYWADLNDIGAFIDSYDKALIGVISEQENKIAQAKIDERNKIIADLSHSIKNLIKTVIDPLENLKQESVVKSQVIENALKGANLIREIVNAMNLSFRGSVDDFYYDAKHNTGTDRIDFQAVILGSLKYSVGNMFDGKYFGKFQKKYFPTKDSYLTAKSEWADVSQADASTIYVFLKEHFFETDICFGDAEKYVMGNDKGSALNLLILFQEIILNAVKYSSFVEKDNRFLRIRFDSDSKRISVKVENPFKPNVKTKTTGIGHVIVENFAKLLNAELPFVNQDGNLWSAEIRFPNFWNERKSQ
jgi:tetratricopeptide (TPR) repeat protein